MRTWCLLFLGAFYLNPLRAEVCATSDDTVSFNLQQVKQDITFLASDTLEGRESGQPGAMLARQYIAQRYQEIGLRPLNSQTPSQISDYFSEFIMEGLIQDKNGINVIGMVKGTQLPEKVIVVTAHYDHLGINKGRIYPGADDNASGVAAMLAVADMAAKSAPEMTYIFVATEYEEQGLYGAKAFVANPPIPLDTIKLNINLDMLSQPGRRQKLFIAGTKLHEWLAEILSPIVVDSDCVDFGHDGRSRSTQSREFIDWRRSSDHWPFIDKGIPYLYFGVDDHRHYHRPTDSVANVNWPFYFNAIQTVIDAVAMIEQHQFH